MSIGWARKNGKFRPILPDWGRKRTESSGRRVSRVLYGASSAAAIYLGRLSPAASVPPPRFCRAGMIPRRRSPRGGVASDRVYICTQLPVVPVSFYLAFPSVPCAGVTLCVGSLFLLHFPGSFLRRTLSVNLPCDARTFLMSIPRGAMTRGGPACVEKYSINLRDCQVASWKRLVVSRTVSPCFT